MVALLPVAVIGGFCTGVYTYDGYTEEMKQMIAEQIGKPELFYIAVTMQTIAYAVICGILGYLLSEKVGLMKSFRMKKDAFIKAVLTGAACGAVFSADYWVFGRFHPEITHTRIYPLPI